MDAGDELRAAAGSGAALAALAIARIKDLRATRAETTVYVLRSLKHREEERLLRHVYGESFFLLGVSSAVDERREALIDALSLFNDPRAAAEKLIARDESDDDHEDYGQQVRSVYSQADAYLPVARGFDPTAEIYRFVDAIFDAPFLTPRFEEEAMRLAESASLRSAALGRQVGAALVPAIGTPIVVGTNEVPKPGGGQYWTEDEPDHRDFQTGVDPNPVYTRRVVQELLERLAANGWLLPKFSGMTGEQLLERAIGDGPDGAILEGARAQALIEFTRCVHAEQAAIINAARGGVSTQGSVLFTTTFPCHECAKMIVAAGVVEVQYIEPYPKSLVGRLYRDLIETAPPLVGEPGLIAGKVPFRAFQGIAPRMYEDAFEAGKRKSGADAVPFDRPNATPRARWAEQVVRTRENTATVSITRILEGLAASTGSSAAAETAESPAAGEPGESRAGAARKPRGRSKASGAKP